MDLCKIKVKTKKFFVMNEFDNIITRRANLQILLHNWRFFGTTFISSPDNNGETDLIKDSKSKEEIIKKSKKTISNKN